MKKLGLIGGTTWHSTIEYYKRLNEGINKRAGDKHAADLFLYSFNFQDVYDLQSTGKDQQLYELLLNHALELESVKVDAILLCANTPHRWAQPIQDQINIPLLHIADATGKAIQKQNINKVALLGTHTTMTSGFYHKKLEAYKIDCIVPDKRDMAYINRSIFDDFALGNFTPEHKKRYLEIITKLVDLGAEGVIFGCTEIPLLLHANDLEIPSFDTLQLHVNYAVDFALS